MKFFRIALPLVCLLLLIPVLAYFLLPSIQSFTLSENLPPSIAEYLKLKSPQSIQISRIDRDLVIQFSFSEQEVNEMMAIAIRQQKNVQKNGSLISNFRIMFTESHAIIFIEQNLWGFLPLPFQLNFVPSVEDNRILLLLQSAQLGKIPLPKQVVLENIRKKADHIATIDPITSIVEIPTTLPAPFKFQSVELKNKTVLVKCIASVNSLQDVLQLIKTMLPQILNKLSDAIPDFFIARSE